MFGLAHHPTPRSRHAGRARIALEEFEPRTLPATSLLSAAVPVVRMELVRVTVQITAPTSTIVVVERISVSVNAGEPKSPGTATGNGNLEKERLSALMFASLQGA